MEFRARVNFAILAGITVSVVCGCANSRSRWTDTGPISAWSIVADLRKTAEKECTNLKFAYLLALQAEVDSRPWYAEHALLTIQCDNGAWWLIRAGRNPHHGPPTWKLWSVEEVVHAWYGAQKFERRPTETDVRKYLRDTWWEVSPRKDWRRLRAEVFAADWKAAFGFDPVFEFVNTPSNVAAQ